MINTTRTLLLISILLTVITSLPIHAASKDTYGSVTVDEVTSIYDGDTFRVNIHAWPDIVGKRIPVRVNGADAPEMRGKCQQEKEQARKAKQFTVAMLRSGKKIELKNIRRGKYFRLLADVYIDSKNLADALIAAGLARPYSGGKREGWCN